jgi:DNA-binding NtrC family response regulator
MPRARGIPDASKHEAAPMAAPLPRLVALEDDPDCCKLIQACLKADYSTVFANNGAELLRLVGDSAVDVILLDVRCFAQPAATSIPILPAAARRQLFQT